MNDKITLDYGSGGKKTSTLINSMILPALGNPVLNELGDGAVIDGAERIVFSTDSFVVSPYIFPGGDVGKLAVCGTVNDISMSGGAPQYLSLAAIIEEGFPMTDLERILQSVKKAADEAGIQIVTGDTKVVERGKGDGIYLNTAGIGVLKAPGLSPKAICKGDKVLVSGNLGDHGCAVMLARNPDLLSADIMSDCAPLNELADASGLGIELSEECIPVAANVASACDILGLDPLYSANEGKLIAVVTADRAEEALKILKKHRYGLNAAIIGEVTDRYAGKVVLKTPIGGNRILSKLSGAQLPRIC